MSSHKSHVFAPEVSLELSRVERLCANLKAHAGAPFSTWLAQFDTPEDQLCALKLLRHLRIFDMHEVRQACRAMHAWVLAQEGVDLRTTVFTSLAYGKSGALVQYFYRTSNWLHYSHNIPFNAIADPKSADPHPRRLAMPDPETLVIMDDFVGAGTEAYNYMKILSESKAWDRYKRVLFIAMVGFEDGLAKLRRGFPNVHVHVHVTFKKVFAPDNPLFTPAERQDLREFLARYQARCYPNKEQDPARGNSRATPCGYRDGQAMCGFFYNTQSNTLPIFWSVHNEWVPLFQRYDSYSRPCDGTILYGGYGYDAEMTRAVGRTRRRALMHLGCLLPKIASSVGDWAAVFRELDLDQDGRLSRDEIFQAVGCSLSEQEMSYIMEAFDVDQSGSIDYEEFIAMCDEVIKSAPAERRRGWWPGGAFLITTAVASSVAFHVLHQHIGLCHFLT